MKTSTIVCGLSLAGAGLAQQVLLARDITQLNAVLTTVSTAITQLDASVKDFSGDATQVKSAAASLSSSLSSAADSFKTTTEEITQDEVASLTTFFGSVSVAGTALLDDFNEKKSELESAGLCQTMSDLSAESTALVAAIVDKLPSSAQAVAAGVLSAINGTFSVQCNAERSDDNGGADTTCTESKTVTPVPITTSAAECVPSVSATVTATVTTTVAVVVSIPCGAGESTTLSTYPVSVPTTTNTAPLTTAPVATISSTFAASMPSDYSSHPISHSSSSSATIPSYLTTASSSVVHSSSTSASSTSFTTISTTVPVTTAGAVANAVAAGPLGLVAVIAALVL